MGKAKDTAPTPALETLDQALAVIADKDSAITTLQAQLDAAIEELKSNAEKVDELEATLTELNEHLAHVESDPAAVIGKPTIEIGGKTFVINSGVRHKGIVYSPQQLTESPDAVAAILSIEGQQIITIKEGDTN